MERCCWCCAVKTSANKSLVRCHGFASWTGVTRTNTESVWRTSAAKLNLMLLCFAQMSLQPINNAKSVLKLS